MMTPMLLSSLSSGLLGALGGNQRMSTTGDTTQFPQYGGDTRTAGLLNDYMSKLMAPRANYMPPRMPTIDINAANANAKTPLNSTHQTPPRLLPNNSPLPKGVKPGQTFDAGGRIYRPTTQVSGDQQGDAYIGGTFYDVVSPFMNYQEAMGSIPSDFVAGQPYVYTPSVPGYEPSGEIYSTTYVPTTSVSGDGQGNVLIGGQHWYDAVMNGPADRYTTYSIENDADWKA